MLVFFALLELLSLKVFNSDNGVEEIKLLADAYSFTEDDDYKTDIVCVGSSDMYSGFVPVDLWDGFGYTSVVSCFSHQTVNEAKMMLRQIQKNQDVKLVFLEVDTVYDGRDIDSKALGRENSSFSRLFEEVNPELFESEVKRLFPALIFHNTWKKENKGSLRHPYSHGYLYNNDVVYNDETDYMKPTDEVDMPISSNAMALKSFAKYCSEQGISLVFVEMPSSYSWNYARYNAIKEIADEVGVDFLDLNLMYEEIGINQRNCYRDGGSHLNYDAAKKVTEFLGKYIKENYPELQDHRDDAEYSARWNEDSVNFKKINNIDR